jgi:hypothetical protein
MASEAAQMFKKVMAEALEHLDTRLAMERTYDERDDIDARQSLERAKKALERVLT